MKNKTALVISGPTASGKTSLAMRIARHYGTEIISADSRQCFREMNIGTAKPSPGELAEVPHHFVNSHSIHDTVNAAVFEQYALAAAESIFSRNDVAIVAGGTGLYIKAFCEGLDDMPAIPPGIRSDIINLYNENGIEWLKNEVRTNDPLYFETGETRNPQRLMRALEVKRSTGKSIREFQQHKTAQRSFSIVKYAIDLPREQLYLNVNSRVHQMMEQGLLEEVRSLFPLRHLNALQTVGYQEIFDHLEGRLTLDEAIDAIRKNTRHYARRQLTWLRKDPDIKWITADAEIKI